MKAKIILVIFSIFVIVNSSCGSNTITSTESAQEMEISTQAFATITPTDIPTQILIPTFAMVSPLTVVPPYPTASTVKANAVAFVVQDWQNHGLSSLWIANIDGSGEKKIVESINELENGIYVSFTAMKWSPDGKWISYISGGDLWIVSPDGLTKRETLSLADKSNEMIYTYRWSPDSSQIAYAQGIIEDAPSIVVGLINVETGETSEIISYQSPPPPITLSWSSDGHYLLLSKYFNFLVFDVTARNVVKEIKTAGNCLVYHRGLAWSPNSKWFYHIQVGNGRFSTTQICVSGLDGSNHQIDIGGTATSYPVWDKTGNFLYFVAANTNFSITPLPDYDLRLMRYDVRTQKQERLLSLGKEPYKWGVAVSPDGQMLELHTTDLRDKNHFVFMNIQSLSVTKFSVNLEIPVTVAFQIGTAWAPDNKNLILFIGRTHTPDGVGIQPYGAFHTLDIQTGETALFSGSHNIELGEWAVSPVTTFP